MKVVLAEKPSVARELAGFLQADSRQEGYFQGSGYQVTWAYGHLVTLKEPDEYDPAWKKWSLDTLPILPEQFELKLVEGRLPRQQFAIVKRLFKAATEIICATDAGREGELIFRYILQLTGCQRKPCRRLWLSSLTPRAIGEAFQNLRPARDYDDLYAAARCRSEADWIVGMNGTRNYTVRFGAGGLLWSVGRVQTPVLAMIVRRDDEIRNFRPESFWELLTVYRQTLFKFAGDRFAEEAAAQALLQQVQGQLFHIDRTERKPERIPPPQLYDLTELQRDMNRRFGLSAATTLAAAQALYEAKLITYPRTDSRYVTRDIQREVPQILENLRPLRPAEIDGLDLQHLPFTARIVNDRKVTDHHAILPTGKLPGGLAGPQQDVFEAIVTRLIAAFYPACEKEVTTVHGHSNRVPFRARGQRVIQPGWTALYPRKPREGDEEEAAQELPEFQPGESGPHEPSVKRGETTPPKPYTENTLLGAMETAGRLVDEDELREALKDKGLGTPATRAAIIETLLKRSYIQRQKKTLIATDLGRYLVAIVADRDLKSPELTGQWEAKLRQIEAGRLEPQRFMQEIAQYTQRIVSGHPAGVDPDGWGTCPRCGRPVIQGKRGYGCSGWRDGCSFVLWPNWQDRELSPDQIRQLLQRRVLLQPVTSSPGSDVILALTDAGQLTEIPLPDSSRQERGKRGKVPRRPGRSPGQPGVDSTSSGKQGKTSRGFGRQVGQTEAGSTSRGRQGKTPRRSSRQSPAARRLASAGLSPEDLGSEPDGNESAGAQSLGVCPLCGAAVVEQKKSYSCSGWREGCPLVIWKTIAGKRITAATARQLLQAGHTAKLPGFKSKAGKPFEARLKLVEGQVKFDFAD